MWPETGIFEFIRHLPAELSEQNVPAVLPSKVLADYSPAETIDVPETISWADIEKDTSAWMGNDKQRTAFHALEAARVYAKDKQIWGISRRVITFTPWHQSMVPAAKCIHPSVILQERKRSGHT